MKTNKQLVLMALQTGPGVPVTPTVALHALRVANINFTPMQAEEKELEYAKEEFGSRKKIITRVNSQLTFDMYVAGSGTPGTAPPVGIPLQACAMAETIVPDTSVDYSLVSEGYLFATIWFYWDGRLHKMSDVLGTFNKTYQAGELPKWSFDFQGDFIMPEDATIPNAIDWSRYIDPRAAIPKFTGEIDIFGVKTFKVKQFTVNGNRTITRPPWVNYNETLISDATPDGNFELASELLALLNFFDKAQKSEEGPLLYTHGNEPGNIIVTKVPKAAVSNPAYGDNEGTLTDTINYTALNGDVEGDVGFSFK